MPIYLYVDTNTGLEVEVIRSFQDYELPPTDGDLDEIERGKERKWERRISKLAFVAKGESWGPGKGNWGRS